MTVARSFHVCLVTLWFQLTLAEMNMIHISNILVLGWSMSLLLFLTTISIMCILSLNLSSVAQLNWTLDKDTAHKVWSFQQHLHVFSCVSGSHLSPSSTQQQNAAGDMQAVEVGRELRRIGDDFNNHLLVRVSDDWHCKCICGRRDLIL